MSSDEVRRNVYLETIARLEPDLAMVDRDAALASIAISLKRIADYLDGNGPALFTERLCDAISAGLHHGLVSKR